VAAAVSAANVLLGLAALPESLPKARRRAFTRADLNPFAALRDAFRLPGLGLPLALLFLFEFTNMVYPTLWSFWARATFGWTAALIGASLATYGIGVAFSQAVVLRVLVRRIGEYRTLMIGTAVAVATFFAFGFTRTGWVVFALLPFACLADMVPPTMTALMSGRVAEDRQGLLQGVIASLGSIAAVVAPLILTPVFHAFAGGQTRIDWPGMPFLMGGVLLAAALPAFLRLAPGAGGESAPPLARSR
jgi:DHA1 family tetracycline resistance protein-like MFS transporter